MDYTGVTDWHSHILPGVDDGVATVEDSVRILSEYEKMGFKRVWLTPHIMEDIPNSTEFLQSRFSDLKNHYTGNIELRLAAENMLDNLFLERLKADDLLPVGEKKKMLLVETSYFNPPLELHETLELIKGKGYRPLLAHPERYNYIDSLRDYERLKEGGAFFQLNILSLSGCYGKSAKEKSLIILKKGLYDFIGSDIHRPEQLLLLNRLSLTKEVSHALQNITQKL